MSAVADEAGDAGDVRFFTHGSILIEALM